MPRETLIRFAHVIVSLHQRLKISKSNSYRECLLLGWMAEWLEVQTSVRQGVVASQLPVIEVDNHVPGVVMTMAGVS